MELTMSNWLQLIITLCTFAAGFGALKQKIEFQSESMKTLKEQIDKLEEKQDRHNGFMARLATAENNINNNAATCVSTSSRLLGIEKDFIRIESSVKSAHHRIDELSE